MTILEDSKSESYLLARMLGSINAVNDAIAALKSEDFSDPLHQAIFLSMAILYAQDCEIEPMSVSVVLKNEFPTMADTAYLFGLKMHQYGDYEDVKVFIRSIKECSRLKKFSKIGNEMILDCMNRKKNSDEIHNETLTKIETVFSENYEKNSLTMDKIATGEYAESGVDFLTYVEKQMENHRNGIKVLRGLPTGYSRLDEMLSGFCKGHYVVIGARPGAGKTTLALNMIYNLVKKKISVGFFSLEMTAQEAMKKLIGIDSAVDMEKAERGSINTEEFHRVMVSSKNIQNIPLVIDDQESLRVSHLISRAKRMVSANKIEVLFIDYLGEIKGDGKFNTKQDEIQYVSKSLRAMAKKLKIPVICIAQLNRDNEKESRAPRKSDLRESGQIEADAHSILLLHKTSIDDKNDQPGMVKLYVVKNRFGKEGCVCFSFDGEKSKFSELDYSKVREYQNE